MKLIDKGGWLVAAMLAIVVFCQHRILRIERGELLFVDSTPGVFQGGQVSVDKTDRLITGEGMFFPIILWEDSDGNVYSKHGTLMGRVYIEYDLSASCEEIAFYRNYFPPPS